jgi:hypothetical protein
VLQVHGDSGYRNASSVIQHRSNGNRNAFSLKHAMLQNKSKKTPCSHLYVFYLADEILIDRETLKLIARESICTGHYVVLFKMHKQYSSRTGGSQPACVALLHLPICALREEACAKVVLPT